MLCFTCFFSAFSLCLFQLNNDPSQQAHCLDSAEALLADSVGSVVCKTKSFARVTHCYSPTCTLYCAVLLTHGSLYCSPITFDPPTPSLQLTLLIITTKKSQEEKNITWENLTLNPVVDSPTSHVVSIVDLAFFQFEAWAYATVLVYRQGTSSQYQYCYLDLVI